MALTDYPHLIEIQSLYKSINKEQAEIDDQLSRLSKLEETKKQKNTSLNEANLEIEDFKKSNLDLENKIFDIEKKINNIEKNKALIKNENEATSYQKQNLALNEEKDNLESSYFEILEKVEKLEISISDLNEFTKGLERSINTVIEEVDDFKQNKEKIIHNLKDRISKVKIQCTPSFISEFEFVLKKHKTKQLSLMKKNGECSICGFIIDVSDRKQIESGTSAQVCASCGRLLFVN